MIKITKEIQKRIDNQRYYDTDSFIDDCKTYVKAVKSGRIQYTVTHVSNSGMSRDINIRSFEGKMNKGYYRSYTAMLEVMGYRFKGNTSSIVISGCGMDMLFATNYNIIHDIKRMGIITKKSCDVLA